MQTEDRDNYGTPFSYATKHEDNELTITDYNGFVLSVAGEKVVTDVTANDGIQGRHLKNDNMHMKFRCLAHDLHHLVLT